MPKESRRARGERAAAILAGLAELYPDSRCSLTHDGPLQLLVATVLSAQCTDAAVNRATPALFARFRTAQDYADASQEEMEQALRTINFFRNKAKSLIGLGRALVERHRGEVPVDLHALTALPGVGRKTANVVLGVGFGIAHGVVVDTHVKRIAARLGLTAQEDPEKVERDLLALLPVEERVVFTHRVIDHGRAVCTARRAFCETCTLAALCPSSPLHAPRRAPPKRTAAGSISARKPTPA
ncbi:MAG: DNA-(apurinic or apyrimidinic site) lyase / endonuclease [Gemmatimonadetes bacterium]|nr:DNA-(apurinic or apyrimidinic site) lyase / endonuclease [Gemmatimonadota bacterium]